MENCPLLTATSPHYCLSQRAKLTMAPTTAPQSALPAATETREMHDRRFGDRKPDARVRRWPGPPGPEEFSQNGPQSRATQGKLSWAGYPQTAFVNTGRAGHVERQA